MPAEFGLVGIGLAIINVIRIVTDLGFAGGLIQDKNADSVTYSSAFFCNIALSASAVGLIQLAAPLIMLYNSNPDLVMIIRLSSLSLVFSSFNLVQRTILQKHLQFKKLAVQQIISQIFGGVLGIVAAFQGYGVYALVIQTLSASLVQTIIFWRSPEWSPRWEFSYARVKGVLNFSIFLFFENLLSALFKRFDVLFIGRVFSPASVGYYVRAESLNTLVTNNSSQSLVRVYFPVLSKLQDDHEAFNALYLRLVSIICFLAFGLSGLLFLSGESLIVLLFGEKWASSVILFQILAFRALVDPLSSIMNYTILSKGKSKIYFYISTLRKSLKVIPYIIGYFIGLKEFAIAVVLTNYVDLTITMFLVKHVVGIPVSYNFRKILECLPPLVLFVAIKLLFFREPGNLMIPILLAAAYGVVYLGYSFLVKIEGFDFLQTRLKETYYKFKRR